MAHRDLIKAINRAAILNVIKARGPIARMDIARLTNLSPATVTGLTAALIKDGLILEKQEGDSRGGRRPILLALDASGAYVVGIKLAEDDATLALTDLNAQIVARQTVRLTAPSPQHVCKLLAGAVRELLRAANVDRTRLIGVGVGVAGIVDSESGICRVSPYNGWVDVPFAELLGKQLQFPVYLDNNVNTLTLVERLYGPGQHVDDFLVVTIGRGVGMGIVVNGQIYRGSRGGAGEFGHMVIDPEGPPCTCGNRGCLETFVSETWLARRAQMDGMRVNSPERLLEYASGGSRPAQAIIGNGGRVLGQAIASMVNVFNPSLIIISGEGVRFGDHLLGPMREAMQRHIFGPLAKDVEVRVEPLSDDTWARGAASLVLSRIFHTPVIQEQPAAEV